MNLHKSWAETKAEDLKTQTGRFTTHDTSTFSDAVLGILLLNFTEADTMNKKIYI
jgi:hypothetical protein